MGYETTFSGSLSITPALKPEHLKYIAAFCSTRRMRRDPKLTMQMSDPLREKVGLPIGPEGDFYVGDTEGTGLDAYGQTRSSDIVDYNKEPRAQHGLWCGWEPNEDGDELMAQDGKNYDYIPWLKYLVKNFFDRWGYKLDGEIEWDGEEHGDTGKIVVSDSVVKTLKAKITYEEEE